MSRAGAALVAIAVGALLVACDRDGDGRSVASRRTTTSARGLTTTTTAPPVVEDTTPIPKPANPPAPVNPSEPEIAATPEALATQVAAVERSLADPSTRPDDLPLLGHTQQLAYRVIAIVHPDWRDRVVGASPPELRGLVGSHIDAAAKLRSLVKRPATELPKWQIVEPAPADELLGYYREAEGATGVPWAYLASIHLVETRMGRIRGTSTAGAQGPMQFLPRTWAAYGEGDINSNRDSIMAAARYLKRNGAPQNMRQAVWNYNHSYLYVDAVTTYAERMLAEPRTYFGYYHWQVYYWHTSGDLWLPVGWPDVQPARG